MNLLLTGAFVYNEEQLQALSALGYDLHCMQHEDGPLPLDATDIDAVVCNGLFLYHDIDHFERLRFIQLTSAGLDRVPLEKIVARNIVLHNARGVYGIPMAEWTVFRILEYYKHADHFREAQNQRLWSKDRGILELSGKTVGIVGAGNVGQEIAVRLRAFGMQVLGFDLQPFEHGGFDKIYGIDVIDEYLPMCDIVVCVLPLNAQTYNFFTVDRFTRMKRGSVFINISRGAVVDEAALYDAIGLGTPAYAVLDVFEKEPLPADSPLWSLPNVALSPHNSFISDGNAKRMFAVIHNNLKTFLSC